MVVGPVKVTGLRDGCEIEINGVPLYVYGYMDNGQLVSRLAAALGIPESCIIIEKAIPERIEDVARYWPYS